MTKSLKWKAKIFIVQGHPNWVTVVAWIFWIGTVADLSAQPPDPFNESCHRIYEEILKLNFREAKSQLEIFSRDHLSPERKGAVLLLYNELDFYQLFLTGSFTEFSAKKSNREQRIKTLGKLKLAEPWQKFMHAEINLHWAMMHVKFGEEIKGIQLLISGKQLLEQLAEDYPEFYYYKKSLGILLALLSTIPSEYQWAGKLVGLDGDIRAGKSMLLDFIEQAEKDQSVFYQEAIAAYSFIRCYLENKPLEGFQFWGHKMRKTDLAPVHVWTEAKLAFKAGYNQSAALILQTLPPSDRDRLPELWFLQGLANLQSLELDQADQNFTHYLKLDGGKDHIKEVWQKRAWIALLKGNLPNYHLYQSNCLTLGDNIGEGNQQAYLDAKSGHKPDTLLLKARLLCDGGFGLRALQILKDQEPLFAHESSHSLEYHYRMGRIYQSINQPEQSLLYFAKVLETQQIQNYLFANAQLQSGLIREGLFQRNQALKDYEAVLKLRPDRYQRSLHQKAKAGISRLQLK